MALHLHSLSTLLNILLFTSCVSSLTPSLEYIDATLPPLLPPQPPKCSLLILWHDFLGTAPTASANYTQPFSCPFPWAHVVLELSASTSGFRKSHTASVWINGAEILRTTGPKARPAYWKVEKDITHYAALLQGAGQPYGQNSSSGSTNGIISMKLANPDEAEIGVYKANVSLHFYEGEMGPGSDGPSGPAHPSIKRLYDEPADMIIPISNGSGCYGPRSWFRVENGSHVVTSRVQLPMNSYRAVMEIFVSYHGEDQNWYTNPLQSSPNPDDGLRHLYATIDGRFIGGAIPFMVIHPGSINPFFWSPVSAIGTFNMPTYDLDLTPFLSILLDGAHHEFGLGIQQARAHWLLSANLHIWLDPWSDSCQAGLAQYNAPVPPLKINCKAQWRPTDGESVINAEGKVRFAGWVSSSRGNLTTTVSYEIKFSSQVQVQNRGSVKRVQVENKAAALVEVVKGDQFIGRVQFSREAPLQVLASSVRVLGGVVFEKTRLTHKLEEIAYLSGNQGMTTMNELRDEQDAEGTALMKDGEAMWGSGNTSSRYKYKDTNTCYIRVLSTERGVVKVDTRSVSCGEDSEA